MTWTDLPAHGRLWKKLKDMAEYMELGYDTKNYDFLFQLKDKKYI